MSDLQTREMMLMSDPTTAETPTMTDAFDIEFDEYGYPDDVGLYHLRKCLNDPRGDVERLHRLQDFLIKEMPKITEGFQGYASCNVRQGVNDFGDDQCPIDFHTGGWSGAEEFIDAVLSSPIRILYYSKWERGGHHYFEVPIYPELKSVNETKD